MSETTLNIWYSKSNFKLQDFEKQSNIMKYFGFCTISVANQ